MRASWEAQALSTRRAGTRSGDTLGPSHKRSQAHTKSMRTRMHTVCGPVCFSHRGAPSRPQPVPLLGSARARGHDRPRSGGRRSAGAGRGRALVPPGRAAPLRQDDAAAPGARGGRAGESMATVLVDLQDVLSIAEIVVRIERGYDRLKGPIREPSRASSGAGTSASRWAGAASPRRFSATRMSMPSRCCCACWSCRRRCSTRDGTPSLIVFDEIQDVLAVPGADGKIRSVIQHQARRRPTHSPARRPASCSSCSPTRSARCSTRRCPKNLAPLPLDEVADYVEPALRGQRPRGRLGAARRCSSSRAGTRSAA